MRRVRLGPREQNLDSFLDVLTNTVGVLVFVLLFVTLSAADATVLVRTPLLADTDKHAALFEVTGDRIVHIDTKKAAEDFRRFIRSQPDITIFNYESVIRRVEGFRTTTDNYRVTFVGPLGSVSLKYVPLSPEVGTSLKQLSQDASEYSRVLSRLKPAEDYVAYVVRPDGIETFRVARALASKRGLQTGWEPAVSDQTLIFGSGGRTIGVQ